MTIHLELLAAHRRACSADDLRAAMGVIVEAAVAGLPARGAVLVVWEPLSRSPRATVVSGAAGGREEGLARAASSLVDAGPVVSRDAGALPAQVLDALGGDLLVVLPLVGARSEELGVLLAAVDERSGDLLTGLAEVRDSAVAEVSRALRSEQLRQRALYDAATGLPGPVLLEAAIADALGSPVRPAVLLVAVDQLQSVARSFGRVVADELARKVAARLLVAAGPGRWTVARLPQGFAVLVPEHDDAVAGALVTALEEPWVVGRRSVRSTIRVGVAVAGPSSTPALLVEQAEAALAEAARLPQGGWVAYGSRLTAVAHEELLLETMLQAALAADELSLRYQPQVDVATGRVTGAEALVRWHRDSGVVTPDRFLPAAERTGVIVEIDRWVVRAALRQARQWLDAGVGPLRMGVNASTRTLASPGFVDCVASALAESGLRPDDVEVEVTESLELLEGDSALRQLGALRDLGVHVALDDFGTGYSNVGRLRALPVDRVKIDRSFVQGIADGGDGEALCAAVIGLARTLDLDVIAEGVETPEQLAVLEARGCAQFQGYLKSPPVPADAFPALVG